MRKITVSSFQIAGMGARECDQTGGSGEVTLKDTEEDGALHVDLRILDQEQQVAFRCSCQ
jgi:hypothetical protein